jgi:hypothetical protein
MKKLTEPFRATKLLQIAAAALVLVLVSHSDDPKAVLEGRRATLRTEGSIETKLPDKLDPRAKPATQQRRSSTAAVTRRRPRHKARAQQRGQKCGTRRLQGARLSFSGTSCVRQCGPTSTSARGYSSVSGSWQRSVLLAIDSPSSEAVDSYAKSCTLQTQVAEESLQLATRRQQIVQTVRPQTHCRPVSSSHGTSHCGCCSVKRVHHTGREPFS